MRVKVPGTPVKTDCVSAIIDDGENISRNVPAGNPKWGVKLGKGSENYHQSRSLVIPKTYLVAQEHAALMGAADTRTRWGSRNAAPRPVKAHKIGQPFITVIPSGPRIAPATVELVPECQYFHSD